MEKEGADTVLGGFSRVDVDGNVLAKEAYDFKIYSDKEVQSSFFPRLMGSSPTHKDSIRPSVWNSMYSMDIIRKNNILFKSEREYAAEDIVFDIEYSPLCAEGRDYQHSLLQLPRNSRLSHTEIPSRPL